MRFTWRVIGIVAIAAISSSGCGRKPVGQEHAPALQTQKPTVPLPDWAPKDPSPEFLRAARVLRPVPVEMERQLAGSSTESAALLQRLHGTLPACWEFFGTLDDHQIERFRTTKELRIRSQSLTAKQRAALDRWFETWRVVMKGMRPEFEDYLLLIYKMGGKEDLSNVDVGFHATGGGHVVHIYFWVKQPDGKVTDFGTVVAEI